MNRDERERHRLPVAPRRMLRASLTAMLLLSAAGTLALGPPAPAQAQEAAISISVFHERLAPHGRWFEHPRYGWAWFPTGVDRQWRPYSRGQWVWTEQYGWYWNSDEPFGWATYHYGRWGYDEIYGWAWIPGNTWGPAWVSFRYGDAQVGWAPLPPETLEINVGFDAQYTDMSASYYAPRWVFVPRKRFLDARIQTFAAPRARNDVYIRQTKNVTNYVTVNNVVVNRSIDRQRMESAIGRRIEPVRVRDVGDARQSARRGARDIDVYRPEVRAARDMTPPPAARARPSDKPRYVVQKDATAPSERRNASDERRTATPTQPPGATRPEIDDRQRARPAPTVPEERRRAVPAQSPATPGVSPDQPRGTLPAPPAGTPRAEPSERRPATPARPDVAPRVVPDEPRRAMPSQPGVAPRREPDQGRRAVPAQPVPGPRATPDDPRRAMPAQPSAAPRAAPDEPRRAMPAQPAVTPRAEPDERRRAAPAQPSAAPRGAPDEPRRAIPAQQPGPRRDQAGERPAAPGKTGDDESPQRDKPAR